MNYPKNLTEQYLQEAIDKLMVAKSEAITGLAKEEVEAAIRHANKAKNLKITIG